MAWDKAQLVELLPGRQTALGLILSATQQYSDDVYNPALE